MSITSERPIIEQIAQALYDRLHLLVAGQQASSCVVEVVRPRRYAEYTPKHLQIIQTQAESERVPELDCPGNPMATARRQRFNLHCHVMPSEKDTTPYDEYANTMYADTVKAITNVGAQWHTFGGLAIDAVIDEPEQIEADGGVDGFQIPVYVIYRVSELNPYTLRN